MNYGSLVYVKVLIWHVTFGGDFDSIVMHQITTMIIQYIVLYTVPLLLYCITYMTCALLSISKQCSCNVAGKY